MKKIEMGKTYTTRQGQPVRVLCVNRKNTYYPVIALVSEDNNGGDLQSFTDTGHHTLGRDHSYYDLIEYNPWHGVEIDAKIFVRNAEDAEWTPRHFAGLSDEGVLAFNSGATSHTIGGRPGATVIWPHAKLA
jgi:hypothetical protein